MMTISLSSFINQLRKEGIIKHSHCWSNHKHSIQVLNLTKIALKS
jgi:hypothetical protein